MPLMHKESQKAFKHNVKEEMEAHPGKSHRAQNLAIAYAVQKKARKEHEAMGGDANMEHEGMHMCSGGGCEHPSHYAEGGGVHKPNGLKRGSGTSMAGVHVRAANEKKEKGYADHQLSPESHAELAKGLHESRLRELKQMDKPKLEAHGSEMSKRDRAIHAFRGGYIGSYQHEEDEVDGGDAHPMAEENVEHPESHDSMVSHDVMNQEGDEDEGAGGGDPMDPVVMKIVMGRAKGYSKGGMVANEDSGESASEPDEMAKWEDNEFDELGKSGGMDGHYSGSEEIGDEQEDHDRDDIVKRVMKSRSKRDRMAVAGEGSTYGKGR